MLKKTFNHRYQLNKPYIIDQDWSQGLFEECDLVREHENQET